MKKRFFTTLVSIGFSLVPVIVFAEETTTTATQLTNPLGQTDVRAIIANIIKGVLGFSGSLALLAFVYGGFLWITSMGDAKRISRGKDIFVWATLGIIMISSAYVIVNAIFQAVLTGSPSVT